MTQPPESPRDPSEDAAPDEPREPWSPPAQQPDQQPPPGPWTPPDQQTPPPGPWTPPDQQTPPPGPWTPPGQQPPPGPWTPPGQQPPGQWEPQPTAWNPPPQQGWTQLDPGQGNWAPQQQAGWEHLGPPLPPARPKRHGRTALIATVAAVALIGGGAATYIAVSDTHSGYKGAASPQEAVTSLVSDLNKSDILGILDHLAPGERSSLLDPVKDSISQAKRLHVLKSNADPGHLAGLDVTAKNITYDSSDETINDHVKIVKLTGGTVTINADLGKVPFTDEYVKIVFPNGLPANSTSNQSIDIADVARQNGEPVRIAAQKIKNKWYPSVFYTIADAAAHDADAGTPGPGDYIAPQGASSPEDAVKQALEAISKNDYKRLIELASPDELAVVHDYGGLILKNASDVSDTQFTIKDLALTKKSISDGTRVSLKSITVDVPDHEVKVVVNGNCLEVTADGDFQKFCADEIAKRLNAGPLSDKPLTAEQTAALTRLAEGLPNIGIDVSSSDGQWYLNPVRSWLDLTNALVEPLHDNDLIVLLKLVADR